MKTCINARETTCFLERLVRNRITGVTLNGTGQLQIGIGKLFHISNLVFVEDKLDLEKDCVSEYTILINASFKLCASQAKDVVFISSPNDNAAQILSEIILGQHIDAITLAAQNAIEIRIKNYTLFIETVSGLTESWRIMQPYTEEIQLIGNSAAVYQLESLNKRWSPDFASSRDIWHRFPLDDGQTVANEPCRTEIISELVGSRITHGLKSSDMNFFDIGMTRSSHSDLGDHAIKYGLHITCGLTLKFEDGHDVVFWGDTPKTDFEKHFLPLMDQVVEAISIKEDHVLNIKLSQVDIEVKPADDNMESWRILFPNANIPHLVASNTWIK